MSRGHGRLQRFIEDRLAVESGYTIPALAALYYEPGDPTASQVASVRRAARKLDDEGTLTLFYLRLPTRGSVYGYGDLPDDKFSHTRIVACVTTQPYEGDFIPDDARQSAALSHALYALRTRPRRRTRSQ